MVLENNRRIEIIKEAILNELQGYQFYKMYADKVSSKEVKDTFLKIADEELNHVKFIKTLLKGNDEEVLALSDMEVPAPAIFRFTSLTPDDLTLAISAFSIAMKMEEDSQAFYQKAADGTDNEAEKKFYILLRNWERVHRDAFQKEYDLLREEWWADNEFVPM